MAEKGDIGGSQTELALPPDQEKLAGIKLLLLLDQFCGAVGRAIIHNEYVKGFTQGKYCFDHPDNIFLFIVCRDND